MAKMIQIVPAGPKQKQLQSKIKKTVLPGDPCNVAKLSFINVWKKLKVCLRKATSPQGNVKPLHL